jgi:cellulose synthase/poly-beta-1,6-N-acetylglucosamine synthase-like glycosyltransferase
MLERTLESLSKEDLPKTVVDIIIVENGGIFGAKEICDKFSKILPLIYLHENTPSSSNARNAGIRRSNSDYLIFFDDDIRLSGSTLNAYVNAFEAYGDNYFFGGPLAIDYETAPDPNLIEFFPASVKGFDLGSNEIELTPSMPLFLGGNHAFPRRLLIKTNGFDALGASGLNTGYIGEETRLQEEMLRNNIKGIYIPQAKVWHYVPSDSCTLQWLQARFFRRGLTEGALLKSSLQLMVEWFGVPRYLVIKMINNRIKVIFFLFSKSIILRIANRLEYEVLRGQMAGYKTISKSLHDNVSS